MPSKKEKQRCLQYLGERIEDSGLYTILAQNERSLTVKEQETERKVSVLVPNFYGTIDAWNFVIQLNQQQERVHQQERVYLCPVLYKDGKTAFVRMVDRNRSWRTDKSLKNYSARQINQMLHLRGIEKAVMERFGKELHYYQPKTSQLEESVRTFHLQPVNLDYSHLGPGDAGYGFAQDREAIDYKLPEEAAPAITGPARFIYTPGRQLAWLVPAQRRQVPERSGQN